MPARYFKTRKSEGMKLKDSKFINWVKKVGEHFPEVAKVGLNVVSGNFGGAISEIGNILKGKQEDKAASFLAELDSRKGEFESDIKAFSLEVEDRKDARKMYLTDSLIQKLFAVIFLIGYGFMCYYMLNIIRGSAEETELFKTMVTMIFTGTSTKLGTIIDFLFGGSVK